MFFQNLVSKHEKKTMELREKSILPMLQNLQAMNNKHVRIDFIPNQFFFSVFFFLKPTTDTDRGSLNFRN